MAIANERTPRARLGLAQLEEILTRGTRYDFLRLLTHQHASPGRFDFFGDQIPDELTAGGAGTAAALVAGGANGTVLLDTGPSDNQTSILYIDNANYVGNKNPVVTAYFKVDSVATGNFMLGFCDVDDAGVLGATGVGPIVSPLTDAPTLTSGVADACVVTYDLSSALATPSYFRLAGARASTAYVHLPTNTASAFTAPVGDTFIKVTLALFRQDLATDNMGARFYVNDKLMYEKSTGAISNTASLHPFILIGATSATRRTLTLDFFEAYQDRDPTTLV